MDSLFVIVGIAIIIVVLLSLILKKSSDSKYPYTKFDALFTPAERSFLGVLQQAVNDNYFVFGKVRVADVLTPKKDLKKGWQTAFNKIAKKHFDYILCDKNDLSFICAIELNDRSHNSKKRKERDAFLEGACQSADLPLLQVTARASYNVQEIETMIEHFLVAGVSPTKGAVETPSQKASLTDERVCPKCSSVMVKKVAKKGKNVGNTFWACSAFPKCKHTQAIETMI